MADNVIKAVFASGRRVKTPPLWRYDHGIRLQPIGLELPEHYEMHFSNSETGEAKTMLADSTGAIIPAEYLIPGSEVYAWVYLVGDSYGRTKAEIIIPVDAKAKSTDQEPIPEQQPIVEQAIAALNDAQDALEDATSQIIDGRITPEEREKLAGIEAGAEVNVIEEVRTYDPFRHTYVPLPITDKGVDLPEIDFPKEVFYHPKFVVEEVDGRLAVTSADLNPSEVLNVVSLHEKVIISRTSFGGRDYYLRLVEAKTDPPGMSCCFSGEIDDGVFLRISDTDDALSWTATMFSAAEDDAVGQAFEEVYYAMPKTAADIGAVASNQGAANDGKVLMVGPDGMVTPQDAAGGTYDYSDLTNKPQINSVTLSGNKSLSDLGIEAEAFVVAIAESNGTYTADKTASQILEAVAAKKRVVATLGVIVFQYCLQAGGKAYFTAIYNNTSRLLAVAETKIATVSVITLGTYSKPSGGIPKTDLASDVQTSLGKADTALQEHQDISSKLDKDQGAAHAGDILQVGPDGVVTPSAPPESDEIAWAGDPIPGKTDTHNVEEAVLQVYGAIPTPDPNASNLPEQLGHVASPGVSQYFSRHDHIHPLPDASDVGAVAKDQGVAHAGEILVVGSDGNVTTQAMTNAETEAL